MCDMHYKRLWRNGSTADRSVGYVGLHDRIYRLRGKAKQHKCVDCGNQAEEWSYNYGDPNQLAHPKTGTPYGSPEYYDPRCRRCHQLFDRATTGGWGPRAPLRWHHATG
jgi:NAD-dependent SIR2 family protein deacetylase